MSDTQNILSGWEAALDTKELELLERKQSILDFVVMPHASRDTQERLRALHLEEAALNEIMLRATAMRISTEFKEEANRLCARCKKLGDYTRDIDKLLADDLTAQYRVEDAKKHDVAKVVAIVIGPPGFLMSAVNSGFGKGVVNVYEAIAAGFAISAGVLFRKKISGAFKSAANAVCSLPKSVSNSFTLYYLRETAKESEREAVRVLRTATVDSFTIYYLKDTSKEKKERTIAAVRTVGSSLGSLLRGKGFAALRKTETTPGKSTITPFPKRAKKPAAGVPEDKKSALG